jgi:hypothetical protein
VYKIRSSVRSFLIKINKKRHTQNTFVEIGGVASSKSSFVHVSLFLSCVVNPPFFPKTKKHSHSNCRDENPIEFNTIQEARYTAHFMIIPNCEEFNASLSPYSELPRRQCTTTPFAPVCRKSSGDCRLE